MTIRLIALLLTIVILSGCSFSNNQPEEKPKSLTVLNLTSWEPSLKNYIKAYKKQHQTITFKIINIDVDNMNSTQDAYTLVEQTFLEKQPDLIFSSIESVQALSEQGKLLPLDSFIKKSKFDLDGLFPPVLAKLREAGSGVLYALSPSFYSNNGIIYNKTLFDEQGVPYPKEGMNWEELLQLASRFNGVLSKKDSKPVYGLDVESSIEGLISSIGMFNGLSYYNPITLKAELHTPGWREAADSVIAAVRSGAIPPVVETTCKDGNCNSPNNRYFMLEQAAMRLISLGQLYQSDFKLKPGEWDIVSGPTDTNHRNLGGAYYIFHSFSINEASSHADDAWDFIQYINGEEYAKSVQYTSKDLLTRTAYNNQFPDHNVAAFYQLDDRSLPMKISNEQQDKMKSIFADLSQTGAGPLYEQFSAALNGEKTADEALQFLQDEFQTRLNSIK